MLSRPTTKKAPASFDFTSNSGCSGICRMMASSPFAWLRHSVGAAQECRNARTAIAGAELGALSDLPDTESSRQHHGKPPQPGTSHAPARVRNADTPTQSSTRSGMMAGVTAREKYDAMLHDDLGPWLRERGFRKRRNR